MVGTTKGLTASTACRVSVNVGVAPRMCIGNKFHSSSASTASARIMHAIARCNRHTPTANAAYSRLDRLKSRTTSVLVGAPIAKSSLTAWSR